VISWKYTFKRLNEEYDIAKKKKQALDNLYASGKISLATRESFDNEINNAIASIEKQQKELIDSMQGKMNELENQLKTLETLLANYEIQHIAGEIDEDIYQKEISLLTTGLEITKNELCTIKQVTNQLTPNEIVAPVAETPAPLCSVAETVVSAPIIEPTAVETPTVSTPVETVIEPTPIEPTPVEIAVETVKAEAAAENPRQ